MSGEAHSMSLQDTHSNVAMEVTQCCNEHIYCITISAFQDLFIMNNRLCCAFSLQTNIYKWNPTE